MTTPDNPILNTPHAKPNRHWRLGNDRDFTQTIEPGRPRPAYFVPIAQVRKSVQQGNPDLEQTDDRGRVIGPNELINKIRGHVDRWRAPPPSQCDVTHETARLLDHWREGRMSPRPFYCQIEAVETIIWLEEVAAKQRQFRPIREKLKCENEAANPSPFRLAANMATGSGNTTVIAMLIAWQAVNAARGRTSFSDAFLLIAPGITIRDRLRVLLPSDTENDYSTRGIVPDDMIGDIRKARVVITNYHAFKLRETLPLAKFGRSLPKGRGEELQTLEIPGQVLARIRPELLERKDVIVINEEAHHCYQENPDQAEEKKISEGETLEHMEEVLAYVKNHGLNFEVPYAVAGGERRYRPDFIVRIDDGRGPGDPLHLVCEIKGCRKLDAQFKCEAMETHWVPAVNHHGGFGRWDFIEIGDVYQAKALIRAHLDSKKTAPMRRAA